MNDAQSSQLPISAVPAVVAAAQQAPAASPLSESPTFTVQEDVPYQTANGITLSLDVYAPAGQATGLRPAVILIHGGGWAALSKSTMRGMGQFLARSGFVAFAVDYRLVQGAENRWPAQLDDVQHAVRWVRAHAAQYSVNPARVGAFGHSAGGQLAALLGMEETRDNSDPALAPYSSRVQAVVDVSGPSDLTRDHDAASAFLTSFLGTTYADHPEVWQSASPALRAAKGDAPFLILHGTEDQEVPIAQSEELYEKLQAVGVPVSFIKVNDVHTFHTPEARHELAVETEGFFNRYLVVGQ